MANKKTQFAVISVVAILLVVALVLSLTAVMGVNDNVYLGSDGNLNVSSTAVNTYGGENGVAKDGTVTQKQSGSTTGYTEIGGDSGNDFSYVKENPEGNYILMGDITIEDVDTSTTFKGILDGNGYTITLNITNRSTNSDLVGGVFKTVDGGTIKNLTVLASTFIVGTDNDNTSCGVFAGSATGGALFSNVCVTLAWSPTNEGNGTSDFYYFQNTSRSKGAYIRLGGLLGITQGDTTIEDTTVENVTTGNYGFSINGWRASGSWLSHSDGFHYMGGFVASAEGGTVNFNRVTFGGNASSKITIRNESTGSYRYNAGMFGCLVGYQNNGTSNVNNVIISYPAQLNTNIVNVNMNYGDVSAYGIIVGWDGDDDGTINVKNMYFVEGAGTTWISGKNNNISGVTVFPASANARFDGESNIAFYGAKKVAPTSSELVAQISHAGQNQSVLTALMLKEGESEETVWLSVPVVEHTDGEDYTLNLSAVMAGHGSVKLESDKLTMTGDNGSAYTATKYYDYQNVQSPTFAIYDKDSQKVGVIDGVYTCANSIDANATYTATPDLDAALLDSGYSSIVYGGVTYLYSETASYVYAPQSGVQTSGGTFDIDFEKNIEVEVLPAPLTVDADFGANEITYYDSLDDIIGKIQLKAVSGEYYASAWISEYAITAGGEQYVQGMAAGTLVNIKINAVGFSDGDSNYSVTYGEGVDKTVQVLVLEGPISGVDNLVYDGVNHTDAVYGKGEYPFEYVYTYTDAEGQPVEEVINAGSYSVKVTLDNDNVVLNNAEKSFSVAPKSVVIEKKEDVNFYHDYNRGALNVADLFQAPLDIEGNPLELTFKTTLNGEDAVIYHAGEYVVTASLGEYNNYTAEQVVETYVVNKVTLEITAEQDAQKLISVYDGEAMTQDEMNALFTAPEYLGLQFPIEVKAQEEIINAGVYTITADAVIPAEEQGDFECAQASVTFTVEQATLNGNIIMPENVVFDGSEKTASFELTEGTLYGEDKVAIAYAKDGMAVESVIDAGEYIVTVSLPETDGKSNYKWAEGFNAAQQLVIEQATVVATANEAQSKTYDGAAVEDLANLFSLPVDIDGAPLNFDFAIVKDGEGVSEIKDAGVYTVTATLADGQDNYFCEAVSATYTVNKIIVEGSLVYDDMTYDGSEKTARFEFAGESPMVGSDEITVEYGDGDRVNVGAAVSVTAQLPSSNYEFAQNAVTTGEIAVESVEVDGTLVFDDMTYDGSEKTARFEFTGESPMVGADEIAIVYGEGDRVNYGASVSVTAQLPSANYTFASTAVVEGVIAVERITVDGKLVFGDMTFDGKEKTAVFEFAGDSPMINGDEITVVYGDEGDRINVGAAVSVTAQLPSVNYVFAESAVSTGTIEVTPVQFVLDFNEKGTSESGLTIVVGQEFVFDAKIADTVDNNVQIGDNSYTYSISNNGWVDGDYTTDANVGEKFTLSLTLTIDGLDASNYSYAETVEVRVIATSMGGTLVADNDGVVYDGSAYGATLTGTIEGVEESDYQIEYALDGTDVWTTEKPVNAGTYKVRVVSLTDNYSADQIAQITFTIQKADAIVIPEVEQGTHYAGHALPAISLGEGSTEGVIVWENADGKLLAGLNSYNWVFTSSDPNYNDATGSVEITAEEVVFSHISVEKNDNFKADYVYGDVFFKDGITVKAVYNDGSEIVLSAEEYTVDALVAGATSVQITYTANEAVATVDGITVSKKSVEVPFVEGEFVYSGLEQSAGIESTAEYTVSGDAQATNAGEYEITLTLVDSDNYKWTTSDDAVVTVSWVIAKKSANITADAQTIVYGETPGAYTAQVSGTVNGENLEYTVGVQDAPSVFVKGEYDIVVTLAPDSAVNANYEISVTNAILIVNAKVITAPAVDSEQNLTYDGTEKTFVIPQGEGYAISGNTSTDAGNYVASVTLTDKDNTTWADGTTDDLTYEWSIAKGTRELSASATLGYKFITVTADNLAEVEYSTDNKNFSALEDGKIAVEISVNYVVYLRYKETSNYTASAAVKVQLKLTKAVLAEYIADSFDGELTFADIDRYNAVKTLAEAAEGSSEEFDAAMANLDAKYNALIDSAKESVEEALGAGATLAGRKVAAAVALSLTGAGAGIAVAALCVKARKGGKKDEE